MLIDTKIVKRLNFPFCKNNAIYLLVDYMERHTEIQFLQQRIPSLIEFMEWQFAHDCRILDQDSMNEYIAHLYAKKPFNTAESVCSYVKSFCKYLVDEGFCGFVSFSAKPRKSSQTQDTADAEECSDVGENAEEQQKRRRGRPKKSQETCNECESNEDTSCDSDQPKRKRGRPRKSEQQQTQDESVNTDAEENCESESDNAEQQKRRRGRPRKEQSQQCDVENQQAEATTEDSDAKAEEQPKKRRGRPRKDQQQTTQDTAENCNTDDSASKESTKKRRGRPPKGTSSQPKLKRVTNYYDALGVTPDADISEIKKAYRKLAMEMHPDLHKDDPDAEKRITSLNVIMAVLKDEVERMVYDVAMGFLEYDERMENVTYKEIKWYTKRHYTVWM